MDPQLDEPDLRSYLGILFRRKWWVVAVTTLVFGVALGISLLSEPLYQATAKVQTPSGVDITHLVLGQTSSGMSPDRQAADQVEYIDSNTVRFAALNAMPPDLPSEEVWNIRVRAQERGSNGNPASSVASVSLVSTDPEAAAQIVRIYAETYVAQWNVERVNELVETMAVWSSRITEVEGRIADLESQHENALNSGQTDLAADLETQLDQQRADRNTLRSELDRLELSSALSGGGGARVISVPLRPDTPISPNIPVNLAVGLVFGLFLGVAVAFLRDYFDDSVKSKDVVEQVTGVPALGLIPKFASSDSELVAAASPASPAAEAFRSLRTSVKFLAVDREVRVVQVTSPSPGEGKTVTAVNLAVVFAQAGDRVVLVGADLRRPRAEDILGVSLTPGLTGVLIGEVALPQAIRAVDGLANLSVLPAGYPPPNPSELLSGERARRLVDVLAQTYDLVVLDCPPVLPVTDALVVARMADTTLLVTSANKTSRRALDRSVEVLQQVGAPLMGTVMTSLARGATFGGDTYGYDSGPRYKRGSHGPAGGTKGNGYGATGPMAPYPQELPPAAESGPQTTTGAFTSAFGPGHITHEGEPWTGEQSP